jgi:hypothetical protein
MAIPGGYRFAVPFDDVFPEGAFVLGVGQAFDWDRNGNKTPAKDNVTGQLVWNVQVTDPSAKGKNTGLVVKITSAVQPVPPKPVPGLPFRPVMFEGLTTTAYEQNGRVQFSRSRTVWRCASAKPFRSPCWSMRPRLPALRRPSKRPEHSCGTPMVRHGHRDDRVAMNLTWSPSPDTAASMQFVGMVHHEPALVVTQGTDRLVLVPPRDRAD